MVDINDELSAEPIAPVDLNSLPAEGYELPQPGPAVFTIPGSLEYKKLATPAGERVEFDFRKTDEDRRLQWQRGNETGYLSLRLSNREFGKRPSKLSYLLAALGFKGTITTNQEVVDALHSQKDGRFIANITWTAKDKNTGESYSSRPYTNKTTGKTVHGIPKDSVGRFLQEFEVNGNMLRAFPDLESFKPAK